MELFVKVGEWSGGWCGEIHEVKDGRGVVG